MRIVYSVEPGEHANRGLSVEVIELMRGVSLFDGMFRTYAYHFVPDWTGS